MEQITKQVTAKVKERAPALKHHKSLCSDLERPDKSDAIKERQSRFSMN